MTNAIESASVSSSHLARYLQRIELSISCLSFVINPLNFFLFRHPYRDLDLALFFLSSSLWFVNRFYCSDSFLTVSSTNSTHSQRRVFFEHWWILIEIKWGLLRERIGFWFNSSKPGDNILQIQHFWLPSILSESTILTFFQAFIGWFSARRR